MEVQQRLYYFIQGAINLEVFLTSTVKIHFATCDSEMALMI